MKKFRQMQGNVAAGAFLLLWILVQDGTGIDAQKTTVHASKKQASSTAARLGNSPAIERLGKMIVGTWAIDATAEPSERKPKGGKDTGTSVIRFGPGRLSLIEDYRTDGDSGPLVALGVFWWDDKAQGYRSMFCSDHDPSGCSVYGGLGNDKERIGCFTMNSRPTTRKSSSKKS